MRRLSGAALIADLDRQLVEARSELAAARAEIARRPTKFEADERVKQAITRIYDAAYASGWNAGVADALIPQSPDHTKALALLETWIKP